MFDTLSDKGDECESLDLQQDQNRPTKGTSDTAWSLVRRTPKIYY